MTVPNSTLPGDAASIAGPSASDPSGASTTMPGVLRHSPPPRPAPDPNAPSPEATRSRIIERVSRLWLIVLAGCGFGLTSATAIDAPDSDAPVDGSPDVDSDADGLSDAVDNCPMMANANQRDWDADTHGDVCDRCPHLASGPDPDGDGDGVGDPCDPRPTLAGDLRRDLARLLRGSDIVGWRNWMNQGVYNVNGTLHQSNAGPSLTLLDSPMNYGDVYVATRMEVVVLLASAGAEIGVCGGGDPAGHAVLLLRDQRHVARACGPSARGRAAGQIETEVAWAGSLAVGALVDVTSTMSALGSACTFAQPGTPTVNVSTLRGGPEPGSAAFYTQVTEASTTTCSSSQWAGERCCRGCPAGTRGAPSRDAGGHHGG